MGDLSESLLIIAVVFMSAGLIALVLGNFGHTPRARVASIGLTLFAVLFMQLSGLASILKPNVAGWMAICVSLFIAFVLGHFVRKHDLLALLKSLLSRQAGIQR